MIVGFYKCLKSSFNTCVHLKSFIFVFETDQLRSPLKSWVQSLLIAGSDDIKRGRVHRLRGDVDFDSSELTQKLTAAYTDNFIWQAYGDGNLVEKFEIIILLLLMLTCFQIKIKIEN